MSSFILSIQRCLGLPLCLFLRILRVVRCVEFGQLAFLLHVQTIGSFRCTTLSSRDSLPMLNCLMSSFLIFCSLEIPAIFRSQLISAVRILFSSCFCIVQHSDPYRKIGCIINSYILILVFCVNSLLLHILFIIPNAWSVRLKAMAVELEQEPCVNGKTCWKDSTQLENFNYHCLSEKYSFNTWQSKCEKQRLVWPAKSPSIKKFDRCSDFTPVK